MLPALEVFTNGLMADTTMYDAFIQAREKGIPLTSDEGEGDDGSDNQAHEAG